MNREDFIKVIPKPTNEDVILYNVSLKDLIDVDVPSEYCKLLPIFKEEKSNFAKLKREIDVYSETINQIFLFNPSWSEETYLQKLQDEMRTYSTLYGNIKRKEDEIKILQKKIESINEKIIIQKTKEEKDNEIRDENLDNEIKENKDNIKKSKDNIEIYKNSMKRIEEEIEYIRSDLKTLNKSKEELEIGTYKCFCCGKKVQKNEAGKLIDTIELKIQKKEKKMTSFFEQKQKCKNILKYNEDKLSKEKIKLENNINFKQNLKQLYVKKSVEILKLETTKNEYLNKITETYQKLKEEPQLNSKKFLELKNKIEKYKVSLENLKKIRNMKNITKQKVAVYKEKQFKIKEMETLIIQYLSFLKIFYKIYEQKASQYAGPDYKIQLFQIKNYDIVEILGITYKGVEYAELSKKNKDIVDKNLAEKFLSDC